MKSKPIEATNFIEEIINRDILEGRFESADAIQTRHPPEPSGYLHIGHVKNIIINYGIAKKYGGVCNLRFDDTNPTKEKQEFVDAIMQDVKWLGFEWANIFHATDYFQENFNLCVKLIQEGNAFVCELSKEELSKTRGTLTEPGSNSPFRNRPISESLDLFQRMKNGEFAEGSMCVRAKIDMASPNINMRDPVIYRIQFANHQRIGTSWCVYPSYDFSHPIDDALEGVTHSMCGIDFENHRPLYDWVVEKCGFKNRPRQVESALLLLNGVILGKRNIKKLVETGVVMGWDDPRLFTLRALKRRGVLPQSLIKFVLESKIGKANSVSELPFLEHFIRDDLNKLAERAVAILNPIELILTNFEGKIDVTLEAYPQRDENKEPRKAVFENRLFIEREDFNEEYSSKFHRLQVGTETRLMGAFIVKCTGFEKDENGNVCKVFAEVDHNSKSGTEGAKRKVKGTIHWLAQSSAKKVEVRNFSSLIKEEFSGKIVETTNFEDQINTNSMEINKNALVDKNSVFNPENRFQFVRNAYYCLDCNDSKPNSLVFNRVIMLRGKKQ